MKKIGCIIEELENEGKCERALAKCKKREEKLLKHGYKWIVINSRTKVFVECDKSGEPTERGQRTIDAFKMALV